MMVRDVDTGESDWVLKKFQTGLEIWEQPVKGSDSNEGASDTRRPVHGVRVRGAVKTRKGIRPTESDAVIPTLPPEDPVVENFRSALRAWEKPFATRKEDDGESL